MTERCAPCLLGLLLAGLAGCGSGEPTPASTPSTPAPSGIRFLASTDGDSDGFARALQPRAFEFPADHGSHPAFRTEWWYFTGNVDDENEHHYGFELTVFRVALKPGAPASDSTLASNEIWMGNLAVTDAARGRFQAAERLSRGAAGLAGATKTTQAKGPGQVVSVEDWSITITGDRAALLAEDSGFGIDLELTGVDDIVTQGRDGLDAKGPEPGNASYYYSAPRLRVTGRIRSAGNDAVPVSGLAWMDREWSTSALSPDLAGWDWFALQLDDGRDLMFYRLRRSDGSTSSFSGGSIVDSRGQVTRLGADDVDLTALSAWSSPATDIRYPVAWQLSAPTEGLDLEITPWLDDQEIDLSVRYWEGAVRVRGTAAALPLGGQGYLELAGY
jgi:predicted secreted hydrolase